MKNNLELTEEVLENILPKYFTFRLYETNYNEDGSVSKLYTSKSQEIFNDIIQLLENNKEKMKTSKDFPNGFTNWQETHFEIVNAITIKLMNEVGLPVEIREKEGLGGLYQLAEKLTDEFELLNKNNTFENGEYLDSIDNFLEIKLK